MQGSVDMTQEQLATKLGMATRNLQRIESGTQNLTLQTIERVANAIGVDVANVIPIVEDRPKGTPFALVVAGPADGSPPHPVPLLSLEAAAGYAKTGRVPSAIGWTLIAHRSGERAFVSQITGRSMEPLIPDRSWSLFRRADIVAVGNIGLFQVRAAGDPDDAGSYVVKRLVEKRRHRIVLGSANREFGPQAYDDTSDIRAVAEWIAVLLPA